MMARQGLMVKRFFKIYDKQKLYQIEWSSSDEESNQKIKEAGFARSKTKKWGKAKNLSN